MVQRRSRVIYAIACSALSYWSGGCAQLLDLPSDPQLADEPAAASDELVDTPELGAPDSGAAVSLDPPAPGSRPPSPFGDRTDEEEPAASGQGGGGSTAGVGGGEPLDAGVAADASPPVEPAPAPGCAAAEVLGPNGRCYFVVTAALSWDDARANCLDRGPGWDLASIRSSAVNQFMGELVTSQAWIGASDAESEGTWLWVNDAAPFWSGTGTDGSALNDEFESWNSDEPNGRGASDCGRLVPVGTGGSTILTWADLECFELRDSVCEGPAR